MTTNHPAHGPVSLDRLHQISEILSKAAAQSDGGNLGYAMADAVKVIDVAIAAFGAEPVAWQWEYRDKRHVTNDQRRAKIVAADGEVLVQPLYSAPSTPVVPEKMTAVVACEREYVEGWNACRAAMLQAGNSPVSPDGWVAVSERIPEAEGRYWCYVEEQNCLGKSHYQWNCSWNGERWWVESDNGGRVTHWMELPAAPHFREISNSSTNNFRENAETSTKCWCRTCRPVTFADSRFVVCPDCGNKRCPRANDHRNACTGSNEPGQIGSAYPAAPRQEE